MRPWLGPEFGPDERDAALAALDALLVELAGTTDDPRGTPTSAASVLERFLADRARRVRDHRNERWLAQRYLLEAPWAHRPLRAVTPRELQRWALDLDAADPRPARKTVTNVVQLARALFEWARLAELIDRSPATDVRVPARPRTDRGWTYLSLDEIEAVRRVDTTGAFTVAIYSGLRAGELWGLRWDDVDLERGELTVRHSFNGPTKAGVVGVVPLLVPAFDALASRPRTGPLVWPARHGGCHGKGYDAGWADHPKRPGAKTRAGISRHVRFHDLRHTCASHLIMGSWPWLDGPLRLEEVRQWLRHSTVAQTERYAHLAPDGLRARVLRMAPSAGPRLAPVTGISNDDGGF